MKADLVAFKVLSETPEVPVQAKVGTANVKCKSEALFVLVICSKSVTSVKIGLVPYGKKLN
jgi:hypothetical protein